MGCVCDENTTGIVDSVVTCGNIVVKHDAGIIATGINGGMDDGGGMRFIPANG
jgi:hypothetical protein